ncbi:ribosomal protein S12 methylthiotransferase [Alkalispirochaeta americana]|uniref:Ribosomal protein uS12 methylthiotransferase RimO n=1 Tax=Alkalispirochaeta americana TaxID=159291 RepID=A0A1N6REB3_9SPIO|nr:30S ribosomal protein S12 methylthiotransferase RimO [Alkalispirochaeta americana]SIQ27032.1 ribosomal protein S12 methylthiotransferase [Alkalispirochaeta americana]
MPDKTAKPGSGDSGEQAGGSPGAGTFYIENLGCAKNQVDAEIMGARLEETGRVWTDDPSLAEVIIVNTCGFIEPAQQESIDTTLAMMAGYPRASVVLAGCLTQRFPDALAEGLPEAAGIFGNREPDKIAEFLDRLDGHPAGNPLVWLPPGGADLAEPRRRRLLSHPGSVFLKVAEGCDHRCTFCAIPDIRGPQRSRSAGSILDEFRQLRQQGLYEFNLVAQDLAAWRHQAEPGGIVALLRSLLGEPGSFWLRPLYLYPDMFPLEVVELTCKDSRLLPYFDLSFQHGSPEILRAMGRPGNPERYLSLIEDIRAINPDAALRSSFIVGYPGETDDHFRELLAFIEAAELEWVGVFPFSAQEGTPAGEETRGIVSPEEMLNRKKALEEVQERIVARRLDRFVGRSLPVLVEEQIQGTEILLGRSPLNAPEVDGLVVIHDGADCLPGSVVPVEITARSGVDLQARRQKG